MTHPDMSSVRCKSCKFFERSNKGMDHTCNSPKFITWDITEDDQISCWGEHARFVEINVGENFGCVHFEQKEQP